MHQQAAAFGFTDAKPSALGPMWASAPTKNVRFQRRGRCPHRPVGYVDRAVRKNGHACTASHGPMWASASTKNVRFQRRGRCPHRPVGYVDRAVRKNGHACTASHGPMWASAPTKKRCVFPQKTMCILTVGGDAHIAPRGALNERSHETNKSFPQGTLTERSIGIYRLLKCKRSSRTFCNRSGLGSGYLPLQQRP